MNTVLLKEIREKKGLSQEDMASKLGYAQKSGYWHLENGNVKPTADKMIGIKDALSLSKKEFEEIFFDRKV